MALRIEVSTAPRQPKPRAGPGAAGSRTKPRARVPVHSVVIVLRGRKEPWPEEGEYRNDWPELPWSGTRFRVEAVYQRTVAELRARRPALANPRVHRAGRMRSALYTALLVMAEIDPWGHNPTREIAARMPGTTSEIFKLSPTLRAAFGEGELKGVENEQRELLTEAFAAAAERAGPPA